MSAAKNTNDGKADGAGTTGSSRRSSRIRYSRVLPINLRPVTDPVDSHSQTQPESPSSPSSPLRGITLRPSGSNSNSSHRGTHNRSLSCKVDDLSYENTHTDNDTGQTTQRRNHRSITPNERILELRGVGKHAWMPPGTQLDSPTGASLIIRRLQKTKERQSAEAQEQSENGLRELQQTFISRQPIIDISGWEFWANVVGDYDSVARNQPEKLRRAIQDGFPKELRGLLWQVIASSKSPALEQLYAGLVAVEDAPCNNAIAKDLDRTPMAKTVHRDALARLLRAYSLFDPEVGYTQGMAFIAVPLLLELNEPEAFSLFVQLMKTYDFRSVFSADMPGLHLRLYQFDRLLEDSLESVHTHLRRQGVQSSMYASQWFLTLFAYRFPPSLVVRIFDITIAEGMEALLRFAYALMEAAAPTIVKLEGLDHLLPYLKEQIFDRFHGNENELVRLASQVELLPQVLSKFELEYQELNRLEKERMEQLETLKTSNVRLSLQNKNLEATLETLNGEHVQIVNKMIQKRWDLAHLQDENEELRQQLAKSHDAHATFGEVASKLDQLTSELADAKAENEKLNHEIQELREVNKRYEAQLGSLQESLASALENR